MRATRLLAVIFLALMASSLGVIWSKAPRATAMVRSADPGPLPVAGSEWWAGVKRSLGRDPGPSSRR
jgi:hypothetical protein